MGVGNTAPNHALSVNGTLYSTGLIINSAVTAVSVSAGTLTLDMNGENYRSYSVSASTSPIEIVITNAIAGCQGVVYVSATGTVTFSTSMVNSNFI